MVNTHNIYKTNGTQVKTSNYVEKHEMSEIKSLESKIVHEQWRIWKNIECEEIQREE